MSQVYFAHCFVLFYAVSALLDIWLLVIGIEYSVVLM